LGAVGLAALVAYAATMSYGFVWDDRLLIEPSQALRSWQGLPQLLGSHFWAEAHEISAYWRPLTTLTFFLDAQVWGLRPAGFHLTNVLLHVAVSLLVLVLARRLTGDLTAGAVAGSLFALHPVHVESVAFVSGRTDILATLFVLLALLAWDTWGRTGRRLAWAGALGSAAAALAAKEVAVVLPLLLLLWPEKWGQTRLRRPCLTTLSTNSSLTPFWGPFVALVAGYAALRILVLGRVLDAADPATWGSLAVRTATTLSLVAEYSLLVLVPWEASAYREVVPVPWPPPAAWWLAAAWLGLVGGLTVWAAARRHPAGFAALWFWITLAPAAGVNLLPLSTAIVAERFLYLPSVGVAVLLGLAWARLLGPLGGGRPLRPWPALALAALVLAWGGLTLWRNEDWKDEYRLYTRMVAVAPEADLPRVNLAFTLLPRGQIVEAAEHLRKAVRVRPSNPRAQVGLALAETILGDRERGREHARRALALAGDNPNVLASLGLVHLHLNEPAQATVLLERSLRQRPRQFPTMLNLTLALHRSGRPAEAAAMLQAAAAIARGMNPGDLQVDRVTAEVYTERDPERAREAWRRYTAKLRAMGELTPGQEIDLASAEAWLRRLEDRRP
jgi:Tfp pilus assembly protein PilF